MVSLNPGSGRLLCSVIIPVHNGEETIGRCLDALALQTVTEDFEVIVVDDGSTDQTLAHAADGQKKHPRLMVRILRQPKSGLAAARNQGAQEAAGSLLLFVDADCEPVPGWVAAFVAAFKDDSVVGAKGPLCTRQKGLVPQFVQAEYEDRYDRMRMCDQIDFVDSYSAAYRRTIFLASGGFDTGLSNCEDQELSFRLAEKGFRMLFVPDAAVVHMHDAGLLQYIRRKFAMGFRKVPLTRLYPQRMVSDAHTPQVMKFQIVAAFMILMLLPFALAGIAWPKMAMTWPPLFALFALFLFSSIPFLIKLAKRNGLLALGGLFLLTVRSLSLGTGFLAGTIYFSGRRVGAGHPLIPAWRLLLKRILDVTGALIGLAVSIPLVALAAIAIKLDSPGPVFYRQVRIGANGRPFRIVKLRSMVADAEGQIEELVDMERLARDPAFKLANDSRVTRVGRFLRRTSLDEVPQFLNILIGQMSLVGPRPEEEWVVQFYTDHHRKRLAVKPGLTGPMQISGRGDIGFSDRLKLELDYIEHYSLSRDLDILVRTVPVVISGKGAN